MQGSALQKYNTLTALGLPAVQASRSVAADAERAAMRARGVVGVLPEKDAAVTPLRSGLVLATLLMAAKILTTQD